MSIKDDIQNACWHWGPIPCGAPFPAGVEGFWNLFFTFYLEWLIISLSDFFLLDVRLMKKWGAPIVIPGTSGHPDYEFKNWMRKLALPEHLLQRPLLLAAIQAGAGLTWAAAAVR